MSFLIDGYVKLYKNKTLALKLFFSFQQIYMLKFRVCPMYALGYTEIVFCFIACVACTQWWILFDRNVDSLGIDIWLHNTIRKPTIKIVLKKENLKSLSI